MKKFEPDETKSPDLIAENIEQLKAVFPEAFTEGRVDFEVLRQLLGGTVDEREEKYGLNWHGKRRARQLALTPSTGTLMMIRESLAHNLPEPDFAQRGGEFTIALWRDWLTTEVIESLRLNDRQIACLNVLKAQQRIMTMEYQHLVRCSRRTAARDLHELLDKGVIQRQGSGRSAHYVLVRNRAINLPIVPSAMGMTSPAPGVPNRVISVPSVPSHEADGSKLTAS